MGRLSNAERIRRTIVATHEVRVSINGAKASEVYPVADAKAGVAFLAAREKRANEGFRQARRDSPTVLTISTGYGPKKFEVVKI